MSMSHTIEQAITVAIGRAVAHASRGGAEEDYDALVRLSEETTHEVRTIITGQLAKLLDLEAVALEWNDAVEAAIQMVEDLS